MPRNGRINRIVRGGEGSPHNEPGFLPIDPLVWMPVKGEPDGTVASLPEEASPARGPAVQCSRRDSCSDRGRCRCRGLTGIYVASRRRHISRVAGPTDEGSSGSGAMNKSNHFGSFLWPEGSVHNEP
jgi:hypothetical protein